MIFPFPKPGILTESFLNQFASLLVYLFAGRSFPGFIVFFRSLEFFQDLLKLIGEPAPRSFPSYSPFPARNSHKTFWDLGIYLQTYLECVGKTHEYRGSFPGYSHFPSRISSKILVALPQHCKKSLMIFLPSAGMSLTKLCLSGNNQIIPGQGEFG
jgi:hypothetical protein